MPVTWNESLHLLFSQHRAKLQGPPRIAILGVGNPMRSDDAAGILVARALSQCECAADTEHIRIIEAGPAPENSTGELRKFAPDFVLIVDAADFRRAPGTIQWIAEESIDGMSASTHSLPLSMLAHYLKLELHCTVKFLGIQLHSNEVGEHVSPDVLNAVAEVVEELDRLLRMG